MQFNSVLTVSPKLYHSKVINLWQATESAPTSSDQLWGIELEIEGRGCAARAMDLIRGDAPLWTHHVEGSLRGEAIELVLRRPMTKKDLFKALDQVSEAYASFPQTNLSDRTSVHVHENVTGKTLKELHQHFTLFTLVESPLLSRISDGKRLGNHFCLRAIDSDANIRTFHRSLARMNCAYFGKYMNFNMASIYKFNSLEIRGHKGSTDGEALKNYVNVLEEISLASSKFDSAQQILELKSEYGYNSFLQEFVPQTYEFIRSELPFKHYYETIEAAQHIAYGLREGEKRRKKSKKKALEF